jgi:hypothetical protein
MSFFKFSVAAKLGQSLEYMDGHEEQSRNVRSTYWICTLNTCMIRDYVLIQYRILDSPSSENSEVGCFRGLPV